MARNSFTKGELERDRSILDHFISRYGREKVLEAVDEIRRIKEAKDEISRINRRYYGR